MSKREIALFGGSFNPPHIGHTLAITYVLSQHVNSVLVVPAYKHALGKDLLPFHHRHAMARLAFGWLPNVTVSLVERDIGHSRTLDTLRTLQQKYWNAKFRLVVGTDIMEETHKWHKWDEIVKVAPPIILGRPGYPAEGIDTFLPEISSNHVRWMLKQPDVPTDTVVHPDVQEYIREFKLYQ